MGGEPFTEGELELGEDGALHLDERLRFWLHSSGERRALRLRDLDHPLRTNFTGRKWFPLDPKFRVAAAFERYPETRHVEAINIRGDIENYASDGDVVFDWDGQEIRMQAFNRRNGVLFFVLSDGTSGMETYRSARFLEVPPPENGRVVVDFNRAVNPPLRLQPVHDLSHPAAAKPSCDPHRSRRVALSAQFRAHRLTDCVNNRW